MTSNLIRYRCHGNIRYRYNLFNISSFIESRIMGGYRYYELKYLFNESKILF